MTMNRHKINQLWKKYRKSSLAFLTIGLIVFSTISVLALRSNNLKMLELKNNVISADKQNGDVESALRDLRNYVFSHMNTRMRDVTTTEPPIQLANRFNRLVEEQKAKLSASGKDSLYPEAQSVCEKPSFTTVQRASCIQQYVTERSSGVNYDLNLPSKDLYTFDFASPNWSPDLAGFSIVLATLFGFLLIIRLLIGLVFRLLNRKKHNK